MLEMKDRIRRVMDEMHMNQQTFANFVGINVASLSSIFNNRTKPTLNMIEAIKSKIPKVNTDWLMFGTGEMYSDKSNAGGDNPGDASGDQSVQPSASDGIAPDLFSGSAADTAYRPAARHDAPSAVPEIRYVERPQRQITEIRVYFDDQTYETFVPEK